jgi:hypothetical protein
MVIGDDFRVNQRANASCLAGLENRDREPNVLYAGKRPAGCDASPMRMRIRSRHAPRGKRRPVFFSLQKRVKPDPEGWTVHDYINRERECRSLTVAG